MKPALSCEKETSHTVTSNSSINDLIFPALDIALEIIAPCES